METNTLIRRIHALPTELFDLVKDAYFFSGLSSPSPISIDENYLPPPQLQISRLSRQHFAHLYYTHNSFSISSTVLGYRWLSHLQSNHVDLLTNVRLQDGTQQGLYLDFRIGASYSIGEWIKVRLADRLYNQLYLLKINCGYEPGNRLSWGPRSSGQTYREAREIEVLERALGIVR